MCKNRGNGETMETCDWALLGRKQCHSRGKQLKVTDKVAQNSRSTTTAEQRSPFVPRPRQLSRHLASEERERGQPWRSSPSLPKAKEPTAPNSEHQDGSRSSPSIYFPFSSALALPSWRPCLGAHDDMMINPSRPSPPSPRRRNHEKRSASCALGIRTQDGGLNVRSACMLALQSCKKPITICWPRYDPSTYYQLLYWRG
ncbi:hypothetical protein V8C26DRAFT_111520 [Trichoderma gracile]